MKKIITLMLFISFYIHSQQCLPSDINQKDRDQRYATWFRSLPKESTSDIYFLGTGVAKPTIQDAKNTGCKKHRIC